MPKTFGDSTRDLIRSLIEHQTDPHERAEWARIAHGHGHITDDELASYQIEEMV